MANFIINVFALFLLSMSIGAQTLRVPSRSPVAKTGREFAEFVAPLNLEQREQAVFSEATSGNIPQFLRNFCGVSVTNVVAGKTNVATFFVAPDYLAIGSDDDYFLTPLTPFTAQKIATTFHCTLPTRKMVDAIYSASVVKLNPNPLPPTAAMITVPVFQQHNEIVRKQRAELLAKFPLGALTAGGKKDVVISKRLATAPGKVAIYGWHKTNGIAIQPLYLGHAASWADYSHGVRLVQEQMIVNGQSKTVSEVLRDPNLSDLLSDEGILTESKYVFTEFPKANVPLSTNKIALGQWNKSSTFDEQFMWLVFDHGVRVFINAPSPEKLGAPREMKLIFYALPNGNTIEQTIGKRTATNDDWHFKIQQIGAQTRFLREQLTNENIVVVYLENSLKSWPAWRKQFGDDTTREIIEKISARFEAFEPKTILSSHSGGGSFIFTYINSVAEIPANVERIALLDSNYNYETALHRDKFTKWLKSSDKHFLVVLAYHDDVALLNGKPFVSAAGGTWGKSHLMKKDFESAFAFLENVSGDLQNFSALERRLQFFLLENPERKILHTVQVEKNGFIHSILAGTPLENINYSYFGEPVYDEWISAGN